jgi:hypothetical protein
MFQVKGLALSPRKFVTNPVFYEADRRATSSPIAMGGKILFQAFVLA